MVISSNIALEHAEPEVISSNDPSTNIAPECAEPEVISSNVSSNIEISRDAQLAEDVDKVEAKIPQKGDYIAAVYGNKWYVGKVMAIDLQQLSPVHVSFLKWSRGKLKWAQRDELWLPIRDILCKVNPPLPFKKNLLELREEDQAKAGKKFDEL